MYDSRLVNNGRPDKIASAGGRQLTQGEKKYLPTYLPTYLHNFYLIFFLPRQLGLQKSRQFGCASSRQALIR